MSKKNIKGIERIEILQVKTGADLGICFYGQGKDVFCAIDWEKGEMKFKLDFIKVANLKEKGRKSLTK